MSHLNYLLEKLKNLENQSTKDDFIQWLSQPLTRALFLRLEYEKEYAKEMWATGTLSPEQERLEQGKAMFVEEFVADIKLSREMEEEDADE